MNPQIPFHSHLFVNLSFSLYNNNNTRKKKKFGSKHIEKYLTLIQGYQFRTVPASTAGIYRTGQQSGTLDPLFCTGKNTGRTSQFRTIPAGTGRTGRYRKKFFFIFFILSFVIFEFLLGQNGNLFALTY